MSDERLREAARDLYSLAVGEHGHDETHSADWPSCLPAHIAMNRYRAALAAAPSPALTGSVCECGTAKSYHEPRFGLDHDYTPKYAAPSPALDVAAETVAGWFHEAYERLAPSFGYETRKASAVPWSDVPEPNRSLMVAVAGDVLARLAREGSE